MRGTGFLFFLLLPRLFFCNQPTDDLEESLRCVFSADFGFTLIGAKPVSVDDTTNFNWEIHPEQKAAVHAFLKSVFTNNIPTLIGIAIAQDPVGYEASSGLRNVYFHGPHSIISVSFLLTRML